MESKAVRQERTQGWVLILLMVVLTAIFWIVARYRVVDLDEGFYLVSSKLAAAGQVPYLDFFFHQSPLVPFVYGAWLKIFGATWASARGLSALMAAAAGCIVFEFVRRETMSRFAAVAALALYVTSGLVVTWFTVVKTFALTNLLLVSAFAVLSWPPLRLTVLRLAVSGALVGLASATRVYAIVLAPVFVVWIVWGAGAARDARLRNVAAFAIGFAIGFLPCIALFLASPRIFLFNNLGFHAFRSGGGLVGDWRQKFESVFELFRLRTDDGLQFTALAVLSAFTFPELRRSAPAGVLALAIAAVVALVSLLPTPVFTQYYCLCMPFLIVSATLGVFHALSARDLSPAGRRRANMAIAAGVAVFALSAFPSLRFYLDSYRYHVAEGVHYSDLSPAHVRDVSNALDRLTEPGEDVVSFWPGFAFETHANVLPPFNNDFGFMAGAHLDAQTRRALKIGAPSEVEPLLAAHVPRIIVVGNQFAAGLPEIDDYERMLAQYDYAVGETIGGTKIYVYHRN
jgi:hypothetical protein